jgi:alcohol dehydrogenase class IV
MNALCLPPGLRFSGRQAPEAVARFNEAIGHVSVEELARLGGFERLRDFGVPEADFPEIADAAAGRTGNQNMPQPASASEIEQLLRSIY